MKVTVQLITRQQDGQEVQESRIASRGFLTFENDALLLRYTEPKTDEAYGATVHMTVSEKEVLIERRGPISAHMPLALDRRQPWRYDTPYGTMEMSVLCTAWDNQLTAAGGRFYAVYTVETPGDPYGMACSMEILVKDVSE